MSIPGGTIAPPSEVNIRSKGAIGDRAHARLGQPAGSCGLGCYTPAKQSGQARLTWGLLDEQDPERIFSAIVSACYACDER
jgi:hypothetical protein